MGYKTVDLATRRSNICVHNRILITPRPFLPIDSTTNGAIYTLLDNLMSNTSTYNQLYVIMSSKKGIKND